MEMDLASLQSVRDFAEQYTGPVAGSSTLGVLTCDSFCILLES